MNEVLTLLILFLSSLSFPSPCLHSFLSLSPSLPLTPSLSLNIIDIKSFNKLPLPNIVLMESNAKLTSALIKIIIVYHILEYTHDSRKNVSISMIF